MNIKTRSRFLLLANFGLVILLLAGCAAPMATPVEEVKDIDKWNQFGAELEALRQDMKIPGMSAAVVKDGQLAWSKGFGYADVENKIPAAPNTPYHLASVTKTFAAVILMQLVQEGRLSLDDPVTRYGVNLPEGDNVLVRHLMSHTSEGNPGEKYQYNGYRYGLLSQVVQAATGWSLQEWVYERILQPLGMQDTAPSPPSYCAGLPFAEQCERVYASLTHLYCLDSDFHPVPGYNGDTFNAGAGLISTVLDLAKFDLALDANTLVPKAIKERMWTPTVSNSGQKMPYGLGWYTQSYRGTRLIWHTGFSPPSTSAFFLKLPEKNLALIVLANTDMLSRHFQGDYGDASDALSSLVGLAFYKHFILEPRYGRPLPAIDWTADDSTVSTAISKVKDEAVRDILNKEFSARHNLASSLADLKTVNLRLDELRAKAAELAKSLTPQTLDLYAGDYEFPEASGVTVSVTRTGDKLYAWGPGEPPQELLPLSASSFFVPVGYGYNQLDFESDTTGAQATGLTLTYFGMVFTGRRK
jgi:CubicO group peptidase (beta-lactamase class C family)